jgi:pentatricopeptide repeat protein
MKCPNCQSKNRRKARFCRVCGQRLIVFCPSCGTRQRFDSAFCDNCGHGLGAELPAFAPQIQEQQTSDIRPRLRPAATRPKSTASAEKSKTPDDLIQQFIPKELARKLESVRTSGTMSGERRVVTMLFCDVKGSTAAAVNLDPEDWTEIINEAFEYMIKPVYKFEGTVARLMGDGILAFFGAPIAHEDDPQRAVLAGLEIVSSMAPYRDSIKEKHDIDFDVRVGINTGRVVVGAVGSDLRMEYTAMGDAINLAARMEQTAEPGTVQITGETQRLIAPLFNFESLGGIEVKGKDEPVAAYRVLGRVAEPGRLRGIKGLEAPLIGRKPEWDRLKSAADGVQKGVGHIVFLTGEAGLGKSRLIRELQNELNGNVAINQSQSGEGGSTHRQEEFGNLPFETQWYKTSSLSYESAQPYGLFHRLARRAAGIAVNDSAEVMREKLETLVSALPQASHADSRRAFESLFGLASSDGRPPLEGESFKGQLYTVMESVWRQRAAASPVVLVCDDLHWADPASISLLEHLFKLSESAPILFLCALRPDRDAPGWNLKLQAADQYAYRTTEIDVRPLTADDSDLLINSLLTISDLPLALRENIIAKSEGNPFFVEEVIRTLIEGGSVIRDESGSHWVATSDGSDIEIPDNLQSLLTSRIDKLDEEPRRVLQLASLIGRSFYYRILENVIDERPAEQNGRSSNGNGQLGHHLSTLQQADLIREAARIPELEYAFIHALTQEATYRTILRKLRRDYHLRVGEVIEQLFPDQLEEQAPMLARHFLEARDYERAVRYFTMAGDVAIRLYSLSAAVDHYSQAISLMDPLTAESSQLIHLYGRRGRALELNDTFEEAQENYLEMERLADERGDAALKLASLQAQTIIHAIFSPLFDPEKALQLAEEALDLAEQQDDYAVKAKVLWSLLLVYGYALAEVDQAIEYGQQSLALARQHKLADQLPFILNDLGRILAFRGKITVGLPLLYEATTLFREAGNLALVQDNLSGIAMMAAYGGDIKGGLAAAEEGLRVSRSIDNVWGIRINLRFAGALHYDLGHVGQALDALLKSEEGDWRGAQQAWIYSGPIYADLGAASLAIPHLIELGEYFDSAGFLFKALYQAILIRCYISIGDTEAAKDLVDEMVLDPEIDPIPPMYLPGFFARVELALAQGNPEDALKIIRRTNRIIDESQMGGFQAEGLLLEAECLMALDPPQPESARPILEKARQIAEEIDHNRFIWKVNLALAELSEEGEAAELRQEARKIVKMVLSEIEDPELRKLFLGQPLVLSLIPAQEEM